MSDVRRLFYQEVQDKKRTSYGARNRSGRRGARGVSSVKFSTDIMSRKEKREYVKPSEVRRYNYLNISYEEFYNKDKDTQRDIIYRLCRERSDGEIEQMWGLRSYHLRKVRTIFGVVRTRQGGIRHMGPEYDKPGKLPTPSVVTLPKTEQEVSQHQGQQVINGSIEPGFSVRLVQEGIEASDLAIRLLKMVSFFESDEVKHYDVVISIREREV